MVAADEVGQRQAGRVVGLGGVEDLVPGQVRLGREAQHLGEVVDVDVAPEAGARLVACAADDRSEVVLDVALPLHPRRAHRDAADVRTADGRVHELLADDLRHGIGILRAQGMLLVDGQVVGQEGPLGEEPPGRRLRRDVDEAPHLPAHGGLDGVERRHDVVVEDHVGRVAGRLRDRGRVDHGVMAAHDREGVARIGQVGLCVRGLPGVGALEHGRAEVGRRHVVPGGQQGVDGGAPHLAAGAGHEDAHGAQPTGCSRRLRGPAAGGGRVLSADHAPQTPQAPSEDVSAATRPSSVLAASAHAPRRGPRASTAFAAAAPALGSCAAALRRSIAPPWSASALASQRCASGLPRSARRPSG